MSIITATHQRCGTKIEYETNADDYMYCHNCEVFFRVTRLDVSE